MPEFKTVKIIEPAIVSEVKMSQGARNYKVYLREEMEPVVFVYSKGELTADDVTLEQFELLKGTPGLWLEGIGSVERERYETEDHYSINQRDSERRKSGGGSQTTEDLIRSIVGSMMGGVASVAGINSVVVKAPALTRQEIQSAKLDTEALDAVAVAALEQGVSLVLSGKGWPVKFAAEVAKLCALDVEFNRVVLSNIDESNVRREINESAE